MYLYIIKFNYIELTLALDKKKEKPKLLLLILRIISMNVYFAPV